MANFVQQLVQGAAEGFFNDAYLRDFRHASKTFTTNGYANAPKFKWLFHVYFEINPLFSGLYKDGSNNHGLLVKNITLPKFNMTLAEMNQYNRKRYIQTKHVLDPVTVTFHDDNAGLIKKMWYDYYSYYYGDVTSAAIDSRTGKINTTNLYDPDISGYQNWGYFNEPSASPEAAAAAQAKPMFFSNIKIYGFNQHNYSLYTLNNPMIERFEHDSYDYYQTTSTMENKMTLRYESVGYEEGKVETKSPRGFGDSGVYDTLLSPIGKVGGNKSVLGPGGLLDAAGGIMDDIGSGNLLGALVKGATVANTWKNPSAILTAAKSSLVAGAVAAAGTAGSAVASNVRIGQGLNTVNFPSVSDAKTIATNSIIGRN